MGDIPAEYAMPIEIASYDVGPDNCLRPSAILRYQQEAAEQHIAPSGLGWNGLMQKGMAFVASRWSCRIFRMPEMGEQVTLTTWPRERKGARFIRCYEWTDAAGAVLLCGVMQLALVSTTDHRLLRGDDFERMSGLPANDRQVECPDPTKFALPELSAAREYTVAWSDTDRNGHTNNTRYADFMCDAMPDGMDGRRITGIQLHFAGETRCGDVLRLAAVQTDAAYVQGSTERGVAFAARLEWQAR